MHPDVDWPDMLEGRRIFGRDAVRAYWLAQFEVIDPHIEPFGVHDSGQPWFLITVGAKELLRAA
jgi:hypothetical protein